jgi:hypothetical protein
LETIDLVAIWIVPYDPELVGGAKRYSRGNVEVAPRVAAGVVRSVGLLVALEHDVAPLLGNEEVQEGMLGFADQAAASEGHVALVFELRAVLLQGLVQFHLFALGSRHGAVGVERAHVIQQRGSSSKAMAVEVAALDVANASVAVCAFVAPTAVDADADAATLPAGVALATMWADGCASAVLATVALAIAWTDAGPSAVPAVGAPAVVRADAAASAVPALVAHAIVLAEACSAAVLATVAPTTVRADACTSAFSAEVALAVVDALRGWHLGRSGVRSTHRNGS